MQFQFVAHFSSPHSVAPRNDLEPAVVNGGQRQTMGIIRYKHQKRLFIIVLRPIVSLLQPIFKMSL